MSDDIMAPLVKCPDPPDIHMPGIDVAGREFTRGDWALDQVWSYLSKMERFLAGPAPPRFYVSDGDVPPVPHLELVTMPKTEHDRLVRRSEAAESLMGTLRIVAALAHNRDMARLRALEVISEAAAAHEKRRLR